MTFGDPFEEDKDSGSYSSSPKDKGSYSCAPGTNYKVSFLGVVLQFKDDNQIPKTFNPFADDKDPNSPSPKGSYNDADQIPMTFDPFADAKTAGPPGTKEYIHIRIQQRNNKKSLTTIQGLKKEFSYEKILKDFKKEFCCNGNVVQDKELGKVIQLQGDHRKNASQFLVNAGIAKKENIKIHGF
ncbi:protein translation factor SUI1 2-like [Capsicum chacoense]